MISFLQDIRYCFRQFRCEPVFALLTTITLALGIGVNTAVFLLSYTLVLSSLPVSRPGELVRYTFKKGALDAGLSMGQFEGLRARQSATSDLFAWSNQHGIIQENGQQERVTIGLATGSVFSVLELRPYLGNNFQSKAGERGQPLVPEVLLTYDYWKSHFGGDGGVLGRAITINKTTATIIGVLPRGFNGISPENKIDLLSPLSFASILQPAMDQNNAFWLSVMGRLKQHGYQLSSARMALSLLQKEISEEADPKHAFLNGGIFSGYTLGVEPGRTGTSFLRIQYQESLLVLEGLCVLMMLLCTANVALLVFSRISSRRAEFALRSALGAQRGRLFRQVLTETALLGMAGLVLGAAIGWQLAHNLVSMITPAGQPALLNLQLGVAVCGFTALLSLGGATLAALWPAWRVTRISPALDLKEHGSLHATRKLGGWIVPAQVALGVVFLSTAMLLSGTFQAYLRENSGFVFNGVTFVEATLDPPANQQNLKMLGVIEELKASQGIQGAAAMSMPPIHGWLSATSFHTQDSTGNIHEDSRVWPQLVTTGYFGTLGTKIIAGRAFTSSDIAGDRVCLLSATTAAHFFPEGNAIGNWLKDGDSHDPMDFKASSGCRILGITEDARLQSLLQPPPLQVYEMLEQQKESTATHYFLAVRSSNPGLAANALKRVLAQTGPWAPPPKIYSFTDQVNQNLSRQRLLSSVSGGFALLALTLLATGLYGILMRNVSERQREIGVRAALGATRGRIISDLMGKTILQITSGLALGFLLAMTVSHLLKSFLYGVEFADPAFWGSVLGGIAAVIAFAFIIPVKRAASVQPAIAMREQ